VAPSIQFATASPTCELLTPIAASALIGTIRSSTATNSGATSSCTYISGNTQAHLSVTALSDEAIAHNKFIQAERAVGTKARGAFIGDEAFSYPGGITSRVGMVLVTLTGTPAPTAAGLETAMVGIVKHL
jgi:hypothetical protein